MTLQIEYSLKTLKKENDSLKKQLFKFDNNAINEVIIDFIVSSIGANVFSKCKILQFLLQLIRLVKLNLFHLILQ